MTDKPAFRSGFQTSVLAEVLTALYRVAIQNTTPLLGYRPREGPL